MPRNVSSTLPTSASRWSTKFPSSHFWLTVYGRDMISTCVISEAPRTPAGDGVGVATAISSGGWISVWKSSWPQSTIHRPKVAIRAPSTTRSRNDGGTRSWSVSTPSTPFGAGRPSTLRARCVPPSYSASIWLPAESRPVLWAPSSPSYCGSGAMENSKSKPNGWTNHTSAVDSGGSSPTTQPVTPTIGLSRHPSFSCRWSYTETHSHGGGDVRPIVEPSLTFCAQSGSLCAGGYGTFS
jgi:hypothetical protein